MIIEIITIAGWFALMAAAHQGKRALLRQTLKCHQSLDCVKRICPMDTNASRH